MANYKLGNGDTFDITGINNGVSSAPSGGIDVIDGSVELRSTSFDIANAPSGSAQWSRYLRFLGKNDKSIAVIQNAHTTAGNVYLRLRIYNTIKSGTNAGDSETATYILGIKADGTHYADFGADAATIADAIGYHVGDSITFDTASRVQFAAGGRGSNTLNITIPLSRPISSDVTGVTSSGSIVIFDGGSYRSITLGDGVITIAGTSYAATITNRISATGVTIQITFASDSSHTPPTWLEAQHVYGAQAYGITLTFT